MGIKIKKYVRRPRHLKKNKEYHTRTKKDYQIESSRRPFRLLLHFGRERQY